MRDKQTKFEDFLLDEYSNIAQAHFKSMETISTFFRYYLLIMSIPISTITIIIQITLVNVQFLNTLKQYYPLFSIVLLAIFIIALLIFCYITNMRLDAILYARVVNSIRKFFYDKSNIRINLKLHIRTLPQSPKLPEYFETAYFFPVVVIFGIINGVYLFLAFYLLHIDTNFSLLAIFLLSLIFSIFLHLGIYKLYSNYRETKYLILNNVGVDIDGVLNKHRLHFCKLLDKKINKKIDPEEIIIIPVHECPSLDISGEDEIKVFNDPEYWTNMPSVDKASDYIEKIRDNFKIKIYIFSWRPWPFTKNKAELFEYKEKFLKNCKNLSIKNRILKMLCKFRVDSMKQITKEWLKKNNIYYDKLIIEKRNVYSFNLRGKFKNRFYFAKKFKIKFFIEDDLEKAIKLSYICDVVFLFSQPYNEPNANLPQDINKLRMNFPSNIIRVNNWSEIYEHIKRLS